MHRFDEVTARFAAGRIDRRTFLQAAAALGVGSAAAIAMSDKAQAATPQRGGHAKAASSGGATADSLDLATWVNQHQMMTGISINEYLTEIDGSEQIKPRLATDWEARDGGATWVFELHPGIEFSNGKVVDAEDVAGSFMYHVKQGSESSFKPQVEQVEEVKAGGPTTVIFRLKTPNADFPFLTADYRAAILPIADKEPMVLDGSIGAGPYRLEMFDPGVKSMLVRRPDYWKDDVAFFDSVELLTILDDTARQNALITGEIDIMEAANLTTVDRMGAVEGVRVLSTEGKAHNAYPMITTAAPFDNVDVRMAMKLAIDREEFLDKIMLGYGSLGNDHPISKAYRFHDASIPQRAYDPDKARYHLRRAGLESLDVTISVSDTGFQGAVDGAVLYAERAKAAGINLTVERVPSDGFWSDTWMKKPMSACRWYGRPVEDEVLTVTYASGGSWNDTFWKNERFNELLVQARAELDNSLRAEMYGEMQRLTRDDGGQLIPVFAHWVDVVSDRVGTPDKISGGNQLDGFRFAERWWFKA